MIRLRGNEMDQSLKFSPLVSKSKSADAASQTTLDLEVPTLDDAVANLIRKTLKLTRGKIHGPGGAAEQLGINPNTLRSKMKKLKIPHGRYLYE